MRPDPVSAAGSGQSRRSSSWPSSARKATRSAQRPGYPGSDRPDGATADRRRLDVGEAEHLGQHECGVPIGIQGPESG